MLLHAYLAGEKYDRGQGPLSLIEYNQFMQRIAKASFQPSDLLEQASLIDEACGDSIDKERVMMLLSRQNSLAMRLTEWESNGISIVGRGDDNYPACWLRRLGNKRPPFVYYVGNINLIDEKAIGVVGSRDVDDSGRDFARQIASAAVRDGFHVVSGFARGVDQYAMAAALDGGGKTIGVVSEGLLRASSKTECFQAIESGCMTLTSTCSPDIRKFEAWRAMDRNKLIYASAFCTVVVESAVGKGGTWKGAKEAMEMENGHVLVRSDGESEGCRRLLASGASPIEISRLKNPGWEIPIENHRIAQKELFD